MRLTKYKNPAARKQAAFTLIEIITAIGLLAIIVSLLFAVLAAAEDSVTNAERAAHIHDSATGVLTRLRDDLLTAKPPFLRTDDTPGQVFIIKNNADGQGNDELWFTNSTGVDDNGQPIRVNVRYFVYPDPYYPTLKALWRQQFTNLLANPNDPSVKAAPYTMVGNIVTLTNTDTIKTAIICEYVDRFDVQYLSFVLDSSTKNPLPDDYLPALDDNAPAQLNFRRPAGIPSYGTAVGLDATETSPPAVRITMVIREQYGVQKYFFQRVFMVPMTGNSPNAVEPPPPAAATTGGTNP